MIYSRSWKLVMVSCSRGSNGFQTNSKEIAKKAGVSIGSFYAYFTDKRELFKEVFIEYHSKIKRVLTDIEIHVYVQSGDIRELIQHIVEKLIQAHDICPEFHQEITGIVQTDVEFKNMMDTVHRESVDLTKMMLLHWKDRIRLRDIDAASVIIQKTMEEIVHEIKFSAVGVSRDRLICELTDMICRYLIDNSHQPC